MNNLGYVTVYMLADLENHSSVVAKFEFDFSKDISESFFDNIKKIVKEYYESENFVVKNVKTITKEEYEVFYKQNSENPHIKEKKFEFINNYED